MINIVNIKMFFFRPLGLVLALNLALTGCMLGPDFKSPCAPKTKTYTDPKPPIKTVSAPGSGGAAQYFLQNQDIPAAWWRLFHSTALNDLIKQGFCHSPTLEAAKATLRQSQENMEAFYGSTAFPAVSATLSGVRQRFSSAEFGTNQVLTSIFTLYNASVNVSYTLDLFGANRRQLEAMCAEVEYQNFQVEGAYLTLSSNIVTTAITEASLREQIRVTQELIKLTEKQLQIVKKQFLLGGVSRAGVLAEETQLAQITATLPPLEKNLALTRHALSVLVGEFPSENKLPRFYLSGIKLPTKLPISVPSKLVRQRPDIRASEALLHQASAGIGVATANLFPQITLTGNYGFISNALNILFTNQSNIWSYGGQLVQPIFQGGSLRAKRRAAIAAYEQAAAQYRQTVLQAFQNVSDTLRALEIDAKTLQAQAKAEVSAEELFTLVKKQFQLGAVNYLDLLNAERQYGLARINRIQAEATRYTDTAALFQALGGGWWECY